MKSVNKSTKITDEACAHPYFLEPGYYEMCDDTGLINGES